VGVKESCQQPVEKVHCFTKIEGCPDTICIILIRRTYSSKRIVEDWRGKRRLEAICWGESPENSLLRY